MTGTALFIMALIATAVLLAIGIIAIAGQRIPSAKSTTGPLDRRAKRRDTARAEAAAAKTTEAAATDTPSGEPAQTDQIDLPDPIRERREISGAEYTVSRRKFLNRALGGVFGVFLGQFALASLGFLWPRLGEGFGTPIVIGELGDLRSKILNPDGTATPLFVASAQSWIVPFDAEQADSSFQGLPVVASDGAETGLMALWQRCVHLGCRVPSCESSQGFECPCHGSKYNLHGEYEDGPAPRNMDRFGVYVDEGKLVVDTGDIYETPRATNKSVAYPQGPFCA